MAPPVPLVALQALLELLELMGLLARPGKQVPLAVLPVQQERLATLAPLVLQGVLALLAQRVLRAI